MTLTLEKLQSMIDGDCAAARVRARWMPAGGIGSKIFPSTYAGGVYATESRWIRKGDLLTEDGDGDQLVEKPCVLINSAQSEVNSLEEALLDAFDDGHVNFPVLCVQFDDDLSDIGRITTLDAPHRLADAIFRDSLVDDVPFRESKIGKAFEQATLHNATAMYQLCPTALIFGTWDSTGSKGGLGNKFARVLVSEIVGIDCKAGVKTGSRLDPLKIEKCELYEAKQGGWTIDVANAKMDKKTPVLFGRGDKKGKPSAINHGNVTPDIVKNDRGEPVSGGVTVDHVLQTTVLSFPGLRRLRFPDADGKQTPGRNQAARTALAALALVAIAERQSNGLFLRSRCSLVGHSANGDIEFVKTADDSETISLDRKSARKLFAEAVTAAESTGLLWRTDLNDKPFRPIESLIELVRHSRQFSIEEGEAK
jgi:CRISPR-associated protein Csb1